jgi:hypothetical protein
MRSTSLKLVGVIAVIIGLIILFFPFIPFITGEGSYSGRSFFNLIPAIIVFNIASLFFKKSKKVNDKNWEKFFNSSYDGKNKTKDFNEIDFSQSDAKEEEMIYDDFKYEDKKSPVILARCPKCDRENPYGASTCSNCGTDLRNMNRCDLCGKLNDKNNRFCKNCGHDLTLS